jgi:hypothetical protein
LRAHDKEVVCLLCRGRFLRGIGILNHFRFQHASTVLKEPVSCLECNDPQLWIDGPFAWDKHVVSTHADVSRYFTASKFTGQFQRLSTPSSSLGSQSPTTGAHREEAVAASSWASTLSSESIWSEESGSDISSEVQTLPTAQDSDSGLSDVDIDLTAVDPILLD